MPLVNCLSAGAPSLFLSLSLSRSRSLSLALSLSHTQKQRYTVWLSLSVSSFLHMPFHRQIHKIAVSIIYSFLTGCYFQLEAFIQFVLPIIELRIQIGSKRGHKKAIGEGDLNPQPWSPETAKQNFLSFKDFLPLSHTQFLFVNRSVKMASFS